VQRIESISLVGAAISAAAVICVVAILAPVLIPVVFGRGYQSAVVALWLLSPGAVFLALNQVLANLLQGRGRPLVISVSEGVGAVCTVALLAILIPLYGIRGAAIASTVAYGIVTVFLLVWLHRIRRVDAIDRAVT
jgi:O-antigen/teichoic acid export membrane protein